MPIISKRDLEYFMDTLAKAYNHKRFINRSIGDWVPLENRYRPFGGFPTCDPDISEFMLGLYHHHKTNPHLWYLRLHPSERKKAVSDLDKARPWLHMDKYSSFEELYKDVCSIIGGPYINDVACYDVSVDIAYNFKRSIMPKDIVYVHAKPLKAARVILPKLDPKKFSKKKLDADKKFATSLAPACFSTLTAYQIEDLFCLMGDYFTWNSPAPTYKFIQNMVNILLSTTLKP